MTTKTRSPEESGPQARTGKRAPDEIRPILIRTDYYDYADGSAYIEMGKTKVAAAATLDDRVPPFLKNSGTGWVTAEYAMLPCATERRTPRERTPGKISGRTQEIQRLIGRSLRSVTDLAAIGETTVLIDCDVLQADGGTRAASVTAGCIALALALKKLLDLRYVKAMPLKHLVAAVSVGLVKGRELLDLDYGEDSSADLDMNIVETDNGQLVEVQASAEKNPFTRKDFANLMKLADKGIEEIVAAQREALMKKSVLFMAYK
jgi:ribonuclease PH